ncbi:MAG: ATP-binding protein, partial [Halobacteriaceae archaeon]
MESAVFAWSGGKDAAYALYCLQNDEIEVVELMTTINEEKDRSTMHGVHRSLYEQQAEALDLPINFVEVPPNPSNEEYESIMEKVLEYYLDQGVQKMIYADVALDDVRSYREDLLAETR